MSWKMVSDDPLNGVRVYELDLDENQVVRKTEYYAVDDFFGANSEEYKESDGQRWGDGQRVASIPMHIWARELAPAQRNGDESYIKKWLNDYDNRAYRTRKGNL